MALFGNIDMTVANGTPVSHTFTTNQNVIIGAYVANTSLETIQVTVTLRGKVLVPSAEIPVYTALSVLDGKITANDTDVLEVSVDTVGGTADVIFSTLEDAIATV